MVDFELTDEQNILRETVSRFLAQEVDPIVADHERRGEFAWELLPKLKQFGYIGGLLPEQAGGFGMDYVSWAVLMELAGYHWLSMRVVLNTVNIAASLLHTHATPAQRERFLKPLLECKKRFFVGITEPNHGSNVAGMETRAVDKGDHYLINGTKLWITNGIWADFGILMAKVTPTDSHPGGITAFLVEREQAQYSGRRVHTMILQSTATSELVFENVAVPKENVLGKVGEGLKLILTGLNYGRLNVSMGAVGAAQAALDLSIRYAKDRKQFGRPIGSFQLVQQHIVEMQCLTEAARWLGFRAAAALDRGKPARMECSIAKKVATESAFEVANHALQVHGGMGYSKDYPIERIFRDTRGGIIPEGTSEVQTLIIGREILGMSAFE